MPSIIALDGWVLGSGLGGDEVSFRGLLRGLAATPAPGDDFWLHAPAGAPVPAEVVEWGAMTVDRFRRRSGARHFAVGFPARLRRLARAPRLVVSVTHAPIWSPGPVALAVADISFRRCPEHFPPATRARLNTLVPRQATQARAVLTVSEFSRRDILEDFGLHEDRVFVVPCAIEDPVPLGAEAAAAAERSLAAAGVRGPYVLYLGNLHPRKNVARLVRAFARARTDPAMADHQLVIAGGRWWGAGQEEAACAAAPEGSVVLLGRIDDAQREHLLLHAHSLAYVSLFEGFGLPPLEAMARGTPVLASTAAAIPETTGDAAVLVDPLDEDAIAGGLVRLAGDDELRADLRRRGRDRAAHFTLARTGEAARAAFSAVA